MERFRKPAAGDRILILRPHWLQLILAGRKTLEVRGNRLRSGETYFLGSASQIHGSAVIGSTRLVSDLAEWRSLAPQHKVDAHELPYKKTWVNELTRLKKANVPVPYHHPRGAVSLVRYRG
jgi:hypothetical protein